MVRWSLFIAYYHMGAFVRVGRSGPDLKWMMVMLGIFAFSFAMSILWKRSLDRQIPIEYAPFTRLEGAARHYQSTVFKFETATIKTDRDGYRLVDAQTELRAAARALPGNR